jgi:hypothetical protein
MSMNYYNALIEVAEGCAATIAKVPQTKDGKKTKPVLEYEMIAEHPYQYTEEDIAFETYATMHDVPKADWPQERRQFLSQDQACLRVSALGKRYGWGIYNNAEGKTALVAVESAEYKKLVNDPNTAKLKAFRSKRG